MKKEKNFFKKIEDELQKQIRSKNIEVNYEIKN